MSDESFGPLPPPHGPSGYPPPPPPGSLPPPPTGAYQQQGYGYVARVQAELAGFWIRVGAYVLDTLIVGVAAQILVAVGFAVSEAVGVLLWLVTLVAGVLYFAVLEGGSTGQTLGKRICGIQVVDEDSFMPGVGTGRGVGRYFARILSSLPLGLGYFWMLWDQRNQTWHDKLVHTCVVRVPR